MAEEILSESVDQSDEVEQVIDERESKIAYVWDRKTLVFVGTVVSDPDSLDLERWVKPFNSSFDEPPMIEEGQVVVRDVENDEWIVEVDFRGTEYWDEDGKKHTITELGEEVPEGALLEEPVIPPTIEKQTADAEDECTKRISSKWNWLGQINASLGIYSEDEIAACKQWISDHRSALADLLTMDNLVELDVTDDQYWPS